MTAKPEDFKLPEDFEMPEGFERPEGGMPGFDGQGGMNFENFASDAETTTLDISEAHISVEIDGGKESGSLDNIQPGTIVTVTVNGKGKATYVLVSSQSFFGGRGFAQ